MAAIFIRATLVKCLGNKIKGSCTQNQYRHVLNL